MMKIRWMLLLASTVAAMTLAAPDTFGQTVLTDVWKDKDQRGAVKKIAVFWSLRTPQGRLLAENEVVRQLKARGISALPVYVVIEPDKFVERDEAVTKLKDLGVDAVLVLRMIDRRTAQSPIAAAGPPDAVRLSAYYQSVYDASTKDDADMAYVEMNLFAVKNEARIWAARSVTKVDTVNQQALSDFIAVIIDRLAADRMIP
jgi:hypothetical protein